MSNAGHTDDSATSPVADILAGNATETGGETATAVPETNGGSETDPFATVETETRSPAPEETQVDIVVPPVGNPGGVTPEPKKRRGRPPGTRNKNAKVATPVRTGFGVPCSREQAESVWRVISSMTTPAYNAGFAFAGRPLLLDDELEFQKSAIIEYCMIYGDPLGQYGPLIMAIVAFGNPITFRIPPPEWTGLDKKVAEEKARKEKEAAK